jgi:hypothetical protein
VVRADELDVAARHLARWPELPLRILVEDEHPQGRCRTARTPAECSPQG